MQRKIEIALIYIGIVYLLFSFPHGIGGDANFRFHALEALLENFSFDDSKYSLYGPLFSVPLYYLGYLVKTPHWWVSRFNAIAFTVFLYLFYRSLRSNLNPAVLRKFLLLLIAGSMFPKHLKEYYGECFTSLAIAWGLLAMVAHRKKIASWGLIIVGTANTPATIVATAFAVLFRIFQTKRLHLGLVVVFSFLAICLENYLRKGGLFVSGYEADHGAKNLMPYSGLPGFSYPFFFGMLSQLLSFGKGIVWYAPGLLFPLPRSKTDSIVWQTYMMWLFFVFGLLVAYAKWWSWYGGWFWGPRFLLFASIPAALALAHYLEYPPKKLWACIGVLAATLLSVWVGFNGVVADQHGLTMCNLREEMLCWYTPEYSALWYPFIKWPVMRSNDYFILGYFISVAAFMAGSFVYRAGMFAQTISVLRRTFANVKEWKW